VDCAAKTSKRWEKLNPPYRGPKAARRVALALKEARNQVDQFTRRSSRQFFPISSASAGP